MTVRQREAKPAGRYTSSPLELISLVKTYGSVRAVDRVSVRVEPGEILSLLGPSGCGKTTSLRMVAGFIQPDEGHVRIDGKDVTHLPPYRRDTGMVFQHLALFPHMTVRDNIGFGLKMRRVNRTEAGQRVQNALALVALSGFEDRYPRELSGGQQQRVALARALVIQPQLLLLDEPLSSLDAKLRQELRAEIRRIQQQVGITTLFVTHDQEEALSISDRLAVMNQGRVEQIGSPAEIYERPRTAFVASFIGQSNLFRGEIVDALHNDSVTVRTDAGQALHSVNPQRLPAGSRVLVSVKHERVRLKPDSEPSADNSLLATIRTSTYVGVAIQYVCSLDGQEVIVLIPNDGQQSHYPPGTQVLLEWRADDAVLIPVEGSAS